MPNQEVDRKQEQEIEKALAVIGETLGQVAMVQKKRPITDISKAVVILHEGFGMTQQEIASKFKGVSQPSISNYYSIRLRTSIAQEAGLVPALYERAEKGEMSLRAAVTASKLPPHDQMRIYDESKGSRRVTQAITGKYASAHKRKKREAAIPDDIPIPDVEIRPGKMIITAVVPNWALSRIVDDGEVEFEFEGRIFKLVLENMEVLSDS